MIKKYIAVLKINWIQALEYRANAIVGIVAILSGLLIEYQIWDLIFKSQGLSEIRGFSFNELMVFIFLSIMVGQLKSSWHTSGEMIEGIRTGDINKFLIRPISYFWYHFMMFIGVNSLYYTVYSSLLFSKIRMDVLMLVILMLFHFLLNYPVFYISNSQNDYKTTILHL